MDLEVIIYILIGMGIFFVLPSTIYTFMFLGIFYRRKSIMLEKDDVSNTQYAPFAEQLKNDILRAKEISCEMVKIKARDGVQLVGRYYNRNADRTILFIHGYQSNAFNNFSAAMMDFLDKGYNVLLVDQRAHGDSGGRFTTLGCKEREDLLLWIEYADKIAGVENIIIYGISMGATTVGYASESIKTSKVKGLIMEAGFKSFYDELVNSLGCVFMKKAALNYVYLVAKSVLKVDIRKSVEDSLKNNTIPVLFLHGDTDEEVSIDFTQRSYCACASDKEKITVKGAGHTLCYITGGEELHNKINTFIENCIDGKRKREKNKCV